MFQTAVETGSSFIKKKLNWSEICQNAGKQQMLTNTLQNIAYFHCRRDIKDKTHMSLTHLPILYIHLSSKTRWLCSCVVWPLKSRLEDAVGPQLYAFIYIQNVGQISGISLHTVGATDALL